MPPPVPIVSFPGAVICDLLLQNRSFVSEAGHSSHCFQLGPVSEVKAPNKSHQNSVTNSAGRQFLRIITGH